MCPVAVFTPNTYQGRGRTAGAILTTHHASRMFDDEDEIEIEDERRITRHESPVPSAFIRVHLRFHSPLGVFLRVLRVSVVGLLLFSAASASLR